MPTLKEALELAIGHHQRGELDQAEGVYRAILQAQPQNPDALHYLGVIHYQRGRPAEGVTLLRKSLTGAPQNPLVHNNLGSAHVALGQYTEALEAYDAAIRLKPDYGEAYYNRGNVLKLQGQHSGAIDAFQSAVRCNPRHVAAHNNWGNVLLEQGDLATARRLFERAVELDPRYIRAWSNLGWIHQKEGRPQDAQAAYLRALSIKPDYALAHNNLASLYFEQNRPHEALASYRQALDHDPNFYDARCGEGAVLAQQGRIDEARRAYEQALALRPGDGLRIRMALLTDVVAPSGEAMRARRAALEAELDALMARPLNVRDPVQEIGTTPFYLAYQGLNERPTQEKIARLLMAAAPSLNYVAPHCRAGNVSTGDRLRVGLVSKYFYDHPVGKHYARVVEGLDRAQFELFLFKVPTPSDVVSRRIVDAAEHVVELHHQLERAREQIAAARLDLLVHTDVGMDPWTNYLAFARLAPIQCVLGGHPITTGIPAIDYFISGRLVEPSEAQEHYSERLVLLDHLPSSYQRPVMREPLPARSELGLSDEANCYVTCQTLFKYHPDDDVLLGEILRRDPQGQLYFFQGRHEHWTELLRERLNRQLADVAERIHFLPRRQGPDYMQVLALADVLLDTIRFGGGTTTCDAIAAGTPLITLPGPYYRSRITLGNFEHLGVLDTVATSREDYVDRAVRFGTDPAARQAYRERVREREALLFENDDFVRDLSAFFLRACGRS